METHAGKRHQLFFSRPGGVDGIDRHLWWFRILAFIADEATLLDNVLGSTCQYFALEVVRPRLAIFTEWKLVRGYTAKAVARVLSRCPNLTAETRRKLERLQYAQAACEARHAEARRTWCREIGSPSHGGAITAVEVRSLQLCRDYLQGLASSHSSRAYSYIFEHLLSLKTDGYSEGTRWIDSMNDVLAKSLVEDGQLRRLMN
jgi:hypothetical protein